jgi:hypothetical protein
MNAFSISVLYVFERASALADDKPAISVNHLVGAILERATSHTAVRREDVVVSELFAKAGLKWDDETRKALGIVTAEEKAEMKERAELARLRAKYPED